MASQLQIHPKPARWSKLGPLNAFPLPAATMLKFVSRQHRRKGSGEVCVSFSRVTAGFPSSFPSLPVPCPAPEGFVVNASSETPPCEQLFLSPEGSILASSTALHHSDCNPVSCSAPSSKVWPSPGRGGRTNLSSGGSDHSFYLLLLDSFRFLWPLPSPFLVTSIPFNSSSFFILNFPITVSFLSPGRARLIIYRPLLN